MSKYKGHTPGPWVQDDPNNTLIAKMVNGVYEYIAECDPAQFSGTERSDEEIEANARLIADAPMLAERLEINEQLLTDAISGVDQQRERANKLAELTEKYREDAKENIIAMKAAADKIKMLAEQNAKMLKSLKEHCQECDAQLKGHPDHHYNCAICGDKQLISEMEDK